MALEVRLATTVDASGIGQVHVTAFREAYAHLLPAGTLAALDLEQRVARWGELIVAATPTVWVVIDGDAVVGWATTSVGHGATAPRDLELEGIYVLASHYGSGAGQMLLDAAIGGAPAFLWVASDNPRAWSFYRRNGFAVDGASNLTPVAGIPVEASRLVR